MAASKAVRTAQSMVVNWVAQTAVLKADLRVATRAVLTDLMWVDRRDWRCMVFQQEHLEKLAMNCMVAVWKEKLEGSEINCIASV